MTTRGIVLLLCLAAPACADKRCPDVEADASAASSPIAAVAPAEPPRGAVRNRCWVANGEVHVFAAATMHWADGRTDRRGWKHDCIEACNSVDFDPDSLVAGNVNDTSMTAREGASIANSTPTTVLIRASLRASASDARQVGAMTWTIDLQAKKLRVLFDQEARNGKPAVHGEGETDCPP